MRQVVQAFGRVGPQRDPVHAGTPEFRGVDIDLHHRYSLGQQGVAPGGDLAELATDDDQAITVGDQVVGHPAVAPEDTERQGVIARDGAFAAQRVGHRDLLRAGEPGKRLVGTRQMNPAADQQHRALRG